MPSANTDMYWSFGYGSNMDMAALQGKKMVTITEHCPAILRGYRLSFSQKGLPLVEPSFANVVESEEKDEVHGVAFCMTRENMERLDRMEGVYDKRTVTLEAYDGRRLQSFVYIVKPQEEFPPSKRYLGVLCKGARQAGLKEEYIEKLMKTKTHSPPSWLLELRKTRPDPNALREITVEELAKHKSTSEGIWVSCMGYVFKRGWAMEVHKGRDLTSRALMNFNGISVDTYDDRGRPPYPLLKNMSEGELEYVTTWLDYHQAGGSQDGKNGINEIVGYLKEFREQQESGVTTFVLPEIPK